MDIKHRLTFRLDGDTSVTSILEQNKIKHKYYTDIDFLVVEILESHPKWHELQQFLCSHGYDNGLAEPVYTKHEMANAEWFTCRSKWHWEYPQPKSDSFGYMKNITYALDSDCSECGCGAEQIGNFRVRKTPVWNGKNFLMLNWENDVLFLSDNARHILEASDLTGFGFREVYNTKGTEKIADISQLVIENYTEPGLVWQGNGTIKQINVCPVCNSVKFITSGRGICYKRSAFPDNCDIVKSYECFGDGHSASRKIFVSKKVYDLIVENKLDRQLAFEPVMPV